MRCQEYRQWMSAYLDDALAAAERTELEQHLTACHQCQEELASLQKVVTVLQTLERPQPPELLTDIHTRLVQEPWWRAVLHRLPSLWPNLIPVRGLAVALTALLVITVVVIPRWLRPPSDLERFVSPSHQTSPLADQVVRMPSETLVGTTAKSVTVSEATDVTGAVASAVAQRPQTVEEIRLPIRATAYVEQVDGAVADMSAWVLARQGTLAVVDERHVEVRLAVADASAFLERFTGTTPALVEGGVPAVAALAERHAEQAFALQGQAVRAADVGSTQTSSSSTETPREPVTIVLELVPSK